MTIWRSGGRLRRKGERFRFVAVPPAPGADLAAYFKKTAQRFANPKTGDAVRGLCPDGSNRQLKFIIPTIADRLARGESVLGPALESALWRRYCFGVTDSGAAIEPNDPGWDRLTAELLSEMRSRLYERFRRELKATPGLAVTLKNLDTRRCVASSSQPDRIRLSLRIAGLLDFFDPHIYSASRASRGKPEPISFCTPQAPWAPRRRPGRIRALGPPALKCANLPSSSAEPFGQRQVRQGLPDLPADAGASAGGGRPGRMTRPLRRETSLHNRGGFRAGSY